MLIFLETLQRRTLHALHRLSLENKTDECLNVKCQRAEWPGVSRAQSRTLQVKKHHVNMVVFLKNTPEVKFQVKIPKKDFTLCLFVKLFECG